jgi:ATPase subunit of ABC transporter with duplicated ATPase domains
MASIQLQDVSKAYGQKRLFQEVGVSFSAGRRYGITGPNGAGKSTFLKILSGEIEADSGTVQCPKRTSVLKQDQFAYESWRVLDVVITSNARLWSVLEEKTALLAKSELSTEDGERLGELESMIAEEDGYSAATFGSWRARKRPSKVHERPARWQEASRAVGSGAVRQSGRAFARRADEQPRHR